MRCGYVRRDPAENYYGAVFKGDTLALDIEATKAHRANMQRQGLPHDEPITEIIIPFPSAPQPQARSPEHEKMTESGLRLPCSAGVAGDQVARRQRILIFLEDLGSFCQIRPFTQNYYVKYRLLSFVQVQ